MNDDCREPFRMTPGVARLAGSLVGLLCGDALGMPVEGWPGQRIRAVLGRLTDMRPGRLPAGAYTDDGQMALGLVEALADGGGFDPARLAAAWAARHDPGRGYGRLAQTALDRLRQGAAWHEVAADSHGNGAAMRVAPLGAWFALGGDRAGLTRAALVQAAITHRHPEALAGALAVALAAYELALAGAEGRVMDASAWLEDLLDEAGRVDGRFAARLAVLRELPANRAAAGDFLASRFELSARAIESVPAALGAFMAAESLEEAVVLAVNLGGDADTLAAMAGGLAGACWGIEAVPGRWLEMVEGGREALDLAVRAAAVSRPGPSCPG